MRGIVSTGMGKGGGNAAKIGGGLGFDLVIPADVIESARTKLIIGGRGEIFRRPKRYIGDGNGMTGEIYSRLAVADRVYGEAGFEKTWFRTSQYSKSSQHLFAGGGVHLVPNQHLMGARYYFTDPTNFDVINGQGVGNRTRGLAFYSEHYIPVSGRTWIYFNPRIELFSFEQPPGYPNEGRHNLTNFKFNFGVAWGPETPRREPRQVKLREYYQGSRGQEYKR